MSKLLLCALYGEVTIPSGLTLTIVAGQVVKLSNVPVSDARGYPFHANLAADPVLSDPTATGNWQDAYYVDGGTLPANRTWYLTSMPYVLTGGLTVPEGVKFEVEPGVVVKLWNTQVIDVDGTLDAVGDRTRPIIFTSRRDDSALGDTFHDGATTPQRGDWAYLRFDTSSTNCVLDHVDIRYAGNARSPGDGYGFATACGSTGAPRRSSWKGSAPTRSATRPAARCGPPCDRST